MISIQISSRFGLLSVASFSKVLGSFPFEKLFSWFLCSYEFCLFHSGLCGNFFNMSILSHLVLTLILSFCNMYAV